MAAPTSSPADRARRPKNRKAQIALAAAELFCRRGYHSVGVDEIADAVGITGPAIYRHFRTKQAILAHAVGELSDGLAAAAVPAEDARTPAGRLDSALRNLAAFAVDRRTVTRLYQWEDRHLPDDERRAATARTRVAVRSVRALLLDVRPELDTTSATLLTLATFSVLGSLSTHRIGLPKGRTEAVVRELAATVLALPGPPAPEPRAERPREEMLRLVSRRERLLAEAVHLFHQRGFQAVSMEEIGTRAGINASSLYRHFAGKGDLLAAIYHRATERLSDAATTALTGARDPGEALERLIPTYVRIAFDQAGLVSVYLSENDNLPPGDRETLRAAQRRHVDEWVRLVGSSRGDEPAAETRLRVYAALNVVTDLARAQPPLTGPAFGGELVTALLTS
ncbi:TetR/AcrR family transcriptional regulator [Amycolatopsis sp. YIM 10]|uniref:TetR/AcrR family transcriptional regulator n=1 Tax=Amycolatopsis sp. YIM 10 TaxID=2653857 RepID=UPI0012902F36|nr:TetR/AcrR family transcriptional regulator [Amycolatopsis sp. YIM 10]QFU86902.1 Transposon Tn10 TetC protein [Amycolatopsis sp. YIM 10]